MATLVEHAREELGRLGQTVEDPAYSQSILCALAAISAYGHSGGSAETMIDHMERLLRREPLTPLTSDPAEWADRSAESGTPWWQNIRDSRAMSHDGGQTWWYVDPRHPGETTHEDGVLLSVTACGHCGGTGLLTGGTDE